MGFFISFGQHTAFSCRKLALAAPQTAKKKGKWSGFLVNVKVFWQVKKTWLGRFKRYHLIYWWLSFRITTKKGMRCHVDVDILLKCLVISVQSQKNYQSNGEFFVGTNRIFWLSTNIYDVLLFSISNYFHQFGDIFFMHTEWYFETPNHNEYHDSTQSCIVLVSP